MEFITAHLVVDIFGKAKLLLNQQNILRGKKMNKVIRAVEVKSSFRNPNWRGIIDENGEHYQLNSEELCEQIVQGGLYRLTYDEEKYKRDTKYHKKGDPKNMITEIEGLPIEKMERKEEQGGESVAQGGNTKRGTDSSLVPVPQTGGQIATVQKQPTTVKDQIFPLIPTVGTIKLTDKQKDILYADVDKESVEIRPDGLIYLPWMEYVTRLQKAFGMGWGIIPDGQPRQMGLFILWGFYMVIGGKLAGFAIGEQKYQPNNPMMTWGDACEGAKSNALMRLCKGLGISLELWQPKFIKDWIKKYAESYKEYDEKKKKDVIKWRKKK